MWTLLKLKNSGEILSLKTFGLSSTKFVYLLGITSFFVGIIILIAFNPITSVMVKYYEDIKGSYDIDKSHLASITSNGVWLKENIGSKTNIIKSKKIDNNFLIKLSTAVTHLLGNPNFDSMAGKYYARFHVKHEDNSDSYLRKAYTNMDLHTDGTYVKEKTDWLLMLKMEEENVQGGETAMLHLDDWEHLDSLTNDKVGKQNFLWGSPKSKNVDYKVEHPVFSEDKNGKPQISYIDQFPEPKNMEQGLFLQKLSDSLEGSQKKIVMPLPVGFSVVAKNYFWLHGRKPFVENKKLSRELLRIRGSFFTN